MSHGRSTIIAAAGANLGIAVAKALAWGLTGSSAMLAEAVHSLADTGNQALLIVGGKRAAKHPDAQHQFGYGQARYLYAFIVSIVLFTLGGCFALYEAYEKFVEPHALTEWVWVPVVVLLISILLESFSLRTALKEANEVRGEQSLWSYIRTSRSPEVPVVLLEDIAALAGLIFALFGVCGTIITGDGRYDAVGSLAIGLLLIVVAIVLAKEMSSLLIGESLGPAEWEQVRDILNNCADQGELVYVRTLFLGPEEVLIAAKLALPAGLQLSQVVTIIDTAEQQLRAALPYTCRVYLEPTTATAIANSAEINENVRK